MLQLREDIHGGDGDAALLQSQLSNDGVSAAAPAAVSSGGEVLEPDEVLSAQGVADDKVDVEELVRGHNPPGTALFDARRAQLAIDYVRAGNYTVVAAAAAGIAKATLLDWLKEGQRGKSPELAKFAEDMHEAQGQAEAIAVLSIQNAAANGSWQAAAWWLERKYTSRFGRKDSLDVNVTLREQVERLAARRGLPVEVILQSARRIYRELGE
jgi:hypothetical protein